MICAANLALSSVELSASTTSRWIVFTTASGVPAGAIRPFQASASTSMPLSFSVGTFGSSGERFAVVTASILTAPDSTCGTTEIAGITAICTSPRITAVIACGEEP